MTSYTLRDGSTVQDPRLDRLVLFDDASRNYPIRTLLTAEQYRKPRSYTWRFPTEWLLDQGREGACVSCGWGHELMSRPRVVTGINMPWCRERIYFEAQRIDPWPGGAYPGASPF